MASNKPSKSVTSSQASNQTDNTTTEATPTRVTTQTFDKTRQPGAIQPKVPSSTQTLLTWGKIVLIGLILNFIIIISLL
ncbi:MAG: hypothetical protein KTR14_09870 [Vampirovibrio sp.]|nr:hypothetical protein [Vampirovibrio sp.]